MGVREQVLTDVVDSTHRWEGEKQFCFSKAT